MNIQINNCNNIDSATIKLHEKKLNIKYAANGTGKSTIAKAIILAVSEDANMEELMPFKLKDSNPDEKKPDITGLDNIKSVLCFNEEYVDQFVFKQDELINNSFDILIKTETYKKNEQEMEHLISKIKNNFIDNEVLESLLTPLRKMNESFKLSSAGIAKTSKGIKGLQKGNNIQHIPEGLEAYSPLIQSNQNVAWVEWHHRGYDYEKISTTCPFCTSDVFDKKEQIRKVGEVYDKSTIQNLVGILNIIDELGHYLSNDAKAKLKDIADLKEGLAQEHIGFLINVKTQIENFIGNIEKLKSFSGFDFNKDDKVAEKLPGYKLNLKFYSELQSETTKQAIVPINKSIDELAQKAGELQGKINKQRIEFQKAVEKNQENINNFLAYAGYKYKVKIAGKDEQAQLKLLHVDYQQPLSGGKQHLSFGERNAFAIVLFMHECLSKNPDLIILDDPISSFDQNKKYAMLEMLFLRKDNLCLKNKTVLMFTHDMEPIIDTIKSLSKKFRGQTSAAFLKLTGGNIEECPINHDNIQTFAKICKEALTKDKDDIIKLIYLRRHYEILDDKGDAYQVLSNLLHKRKVPIDNSESSDTNNENVEMSKDSFENGCEEVRKCLENFSYENILNRIENISAMKTLYDYCTNGYEKLQVFRLIAPDESNSVIQKFINETYHIENEFICQLDPDKFDTIPEYIIMECDNMIKSIA